MTDGAPLNNTYEVSFEDGTSYTVHTAFRDIGKVRATYAAQFGELPDKAGEEEGMNFLLVQLWVAASRKGLTSDDFDTWADSVAMLGEPAPLASGLPESSDS